MSRRAQDRREQREANRRCATASDLERLDRHYRKLPDDYSAIVRAKERARKGGYELTEAQLDKLRRKVINTTWEDAQTVLGLPAEEPRVQEVDAATRSASRGRVESPTRDSDCCHDPRR